MAGLRNLLDATARDPLRYIICFSSVSARFGNVGQVDYAMANEAVNKIARQESIRRPDCRVLSLNWGPWEGGMVSPALKREFLRRQIPLISLKAGAEAVLREMAAGNDGPVEVVIGAAPAPEPAALSVPDQPADLSTDLELAARKQIDLERCPVLHSHVFNGKPVVPMALMAEWLGHSALHGNPGLVLQGIDDLRVLKGITLDRGTQTIRLMSGRAIPKGPVFEVAVEIRNGVGKDGRDHIHSRATAVLSDRLPAPPPPEDFGDLVARPFPKSLAEVYADILFHGAELQGIRDIVGYSDRGMVARLAPAPPPSHWLKDPIRSRWVADPLVLDAAFQMVLIWSHQVNGTLGLPSSSASYRQYVNRFPEDGVTAAMRVTAVDDSRVKSDFTFLDADNRTVARMTGVETVLNSALTVAFKRRQAA